MLSVINKYDCNHSLWIRCELKVQKIIKLLNTDIFTFLLNIQIRDVLFLSFFLTGLAMESVVDMLKSVDFRVLVSM